MRFLLIIGILFLGQSNTIDLTLIGNMLWNDGIGRLPLILIKELAEELHINVINTLPFSDQTIDPDIQKIIQNKDKTAGNIALLFNLLSCKNFLSTQHIPDSFIKISYSMIQTTAIPKEWVKILNSSFDSVCVPDDFYLTVYKKCGVKIPIFVLTPPLDLSDFLAVEIMPKKNIFTFGMSASLWTHKNHAIVIQAFSELFKNNPNVRLILHCKNGSPLYKEKIIDILEEIHASNIICINESISHEEYINFLQQCDCYILVSKGEGFSITPREALAMGIPCILSNNTAHQTICKSNFVYSVKSFIKEPAFYPLFFEEQCGYEFNCALKDVKNGMEEVFKKYDYYKLLAQRGKEWVTQYNFTHIKKKYISLIKPKKVILGKENSITNEYIMTNSKKLYLKYKKISDQII